jgi:hypothetical protein
VRLLAVADGEDRHAGVEHRLRRARAAVARSPNPVRRKGSRLGLHALEGRFGALERDDLGIDPGLAHAARDELRDLEPKSMMRMYLRTHPQLFAGGDTGKAELGSSGPVAVFLAAIVAVAWAYLMQPDYATVAYVLVMPLNRLIERFAFD